LNNPLAGKNGVETDEIITVQICKPILKFGAIGEEEDELNEEETFYPKSADGLDLEYQPAEDDRQPTFRCFYCQNQLNRKEYYGIKKQ
jgi:hypothetical protein